MKRKFIDRGNRIMRKSLVYLCGCFISLNCSVCSPKIVVTMNSVNHLNEVFRYDRNSPISRTGFEHKDLLVETNLEECSSSNDCLVVHHWYKNGLFAIIVLFYPITSPITLLLQFWIWIYHSFLFPAENVNDFITNEYTVGRSFSAPILFYWCEQLENVVDSTQDILKCAIIICVSNNWIL